MPYINFARKYRPQSFEDLIGQEAVQRTLKNAIKEGRIAQAYLFAGPRGVGKTSAARILSKALNCEKGPTPEPCNKCQPCTEITTGSSMDVIEIDGASHTQVDNVREIRDAVKYMPTKGKYKIYIIDEVHMLSTAAFNALLKTLEEPPPHTVFIMATTEPRKLPLTVISRCQRYEFKPISIELAEKRLQEVAEKEGIKIDPEGLMLLAMRAEGSLRDALSLFEQAVSFSGKVLKKEVIEELLGVLPKERLYKLAGMIIKRETAGVLKLTDELYSQGFEIRSIVEALALHFRNLAVFYINPEMLKLLPGEREVIETQSSSGDFELFLRLEKEFLRIYELVSRSSYPRFVLESELLSITAINPVASARQILEKLKGMTGIEGVKENKTFEKTDETVSKKKIDDIDEQQWNEFFDYTRNNNVILSAMLKNAKFEKGANGNICLVFPESDKGIVTAQKDEIEGDLKRFFKREIRVDFRWERDFIAPQKSVEDLKREAIEDESVKTALEIFEGRIFDVKVNRD
jgi:DNA polymerase-3 subunit gamma/tau